MVRPPRIWRPSSFSEVGLQKSRALSMFVAIAAERSPFTEAAQRDMRTGMVGFAMIALAMGGYAIRLPQSLPFGVLGVGIALWGATQAVRRRLRGDLLDRPMDATRLSRRKTIARLNHERRTQGLDRTLPAQSVTTLEAAASQWERISHALQAETWASQKDLGHQVEIASLDLMEELVSLACGSLVAEQVTREEAPQRFAEALASMGALAGLVEKVASEMDVYARPLGVSAGAPLGAAFPAAGALDTWLEEQRPKQVG